MRPGCTEAHREPVNLCKKAGAVVHEGLDSALFTVVIIRLEVFFTVA